jgi:hypothetical protein
MNYSRFFFAHLFLWFCFFIYKICLSAHYEIARAHIKHWKCRNRRVTDPFEMNSYRWLCRMCICTRKAFIIMHPYINTVVLCNIWQKHYFNGALARKVWTFLSNKMCEFIKLVYYIDSCNQTAHNGDDQKCTASLSIWLTISDNVLASGIAVGFATFLP